ncbi:MAG: hypothetical protein Q8902_15385, partial [Bacteroidota bacterium]|nr:hypothetical protein [Bacteroidota bacterium]MDP4234685.1 hypothetical protein [Bacteroidota bacterium]
MSLHPAKDRDVILPESFTVTSRAKALDYRDYSYTSFSILYDLSLSQSQELTLNPSNNFRGPAKNR